MELSRPTDATPYADDREIADAVLGGDREAFRTIVDREAPVVIATCRRILGDATEAEDVAQDAFLIGYRKLGTYRGDGPLGGWLLRIAIREARDRALRRVATTDLDEIATRDRGGRLLADVLADQGDDPTSTIESREQADRLREAIDELPSHYADAVRLRYLDDLSFSEIAALTGRPEPTVRTHLHRGLVRLRATFDAEGPS